MEIKRHVKNCLGILFGARLIRRQFSYVKDDLEGVVLSASEIRANLAGSKKAVDDWNAVIFSNNISAEMLKDQYKKRRIISFILLGTLIFSLYFLLVDRRIFSGFAGSAISFVLYTNYVLRLYQIRHRELCSWVNFFRAIKNSFREFLPLKLPSDWQLISNNKEEV